MERFSKTLKVQPSSIRKYLSHVYAGLVFIIMGTIAIIITNEIKHLTFIVAGLILIILGLYMLEKYIKKYPVSICTKS